MGGVGGRKGGRAGSEGRGERIPLFSRPPPPLPPRPACTGARRGGGARSIGLRRGLGGMRPADGAGRGLSACGGCQRGARPCDGCFLGEKSAVGGGAGVCAVSPGCAGCCVGTKCSPREWRGAEGSADPAVGPQLWGEVTEEGRKDEGSSGVVPLEE